MEYLKLWSSLNIQKKNRIFYDIVSFVIISSITDVLYICLCWKFPYGVIIVYVSKKQLVGGNSYKSWDREKIWKEKGTAEFTKNILDNSSHS